MESEHLPSPEFGAEARLSRWERRALSLVRRRGVRGFVLWSTGVSVFASLAITTTVMFAFGFASDPQFVATAFPMTVGIPLMVAPTVTYVMARLIGRLDDLSTVLQAHAVTDALTQVGNRRGFFEHVRGELTPHDSRTIAMVDMDDFKTLNDSLGHAAGDRALQRVADWLREQAGSDGYVARFGGDEFVAVAAASQLDAIGEAADFVVDGHRFSVSIGTAEWDGRGEIDDALIAADSALYERKRRLHESRSDRRRTTG